jgi:hypothetical protein
MVFNYEGEWVGVLGGGLSHELKGRMKTCRLERKTYL